YFAGLRFVEKNAQRSAVTHAEMLKLHRIMAGDVMDQGRAGRYRTIRVRVGSHVAPPPEQVQPMMSELLQWWNIHAARISPIVIPTKQEQLLHLLREEKALTPREIWDGVGVSKQGSLDLLRPLIKAGLVQRIGTKKTGRYVLA